MLALLFAGAAFGALVTWLCFRNEITRWREVSDRWRETSEWVGAEALECKKRADAEQRRADLALDRLTRLAAAAPPVSQAGIEEQAKDRAKLERRAKEWAEITAPETEESPLAELQDTERIV